MNEIPKNPYSQATQQIYRTFTENEEDENDPFAPVNSQANKVAQHNLDQAPPLPPYSTATNQNKTLGFSAVNKLKEYKNKLPTTLNANTLLNLNPKLGEKVKPLGEGGLPPIQTIDLSNEDGIFSDPNKEETLLETYQETQKIQDIEILSRSKVSDKCKKIAKRIAAAAIIILVMVGVLLALHYTVGLKATGAAMKEFFTHRIKVWQAIAIFGGGSIGITTVIILAIKAVKAYQAYQLEKKNKNEFFDNLPNNNIDD